MVTCQICGKEFVLITNTHLRTHGHNRESYVAKYPNAILVSEEHIKSQSIALIGKNVGNVRKDARKRMNSNNPMKTQSIAKKMGNVRKEKIKTGEIDVMSNFDHLPTNHEKHLIHWFAEWGIPLRYVGDGQVMVGSYCPDFINEEKKIILELELDFTSRPRNTLPEKETVYNSLGYKVIWVTKMDKQYVKNWVSPFFNEGLKSKKIIKIWTEKNNKGRKQVYNMEVTPNNTYVANGIVVHNCFADAFRASLYTAFFDNSKTMGMRHSNPDTYKAEMDKMDKYRGMGMPEKRKLQGINKAFALEIPVRLGIRFEDFLKNERKEKVSLRMLEYVRDIEYPVMINTKSALPSEDKYLKALADNKAGAAIHVTLISSDNEILKRLEPGAPTYDERLSALKILCEAGIHVVARIEPFLFLLTDAPDAVAKYMDDVWNAGVRNITFDTYSYTANNPGIRQSFMNKGFDFDRIFLAGCDSQPLGSLLLGKFMELFRNYGFSCSTFDMGNVSTNDDSVCCETGDAFGDAGLNYGSTVMAARYIKKRSPKKTSWSDFESYVEKKGGFLTEELRMEVKHLWNLEGNLAYSHKWAAGLIPTGRDNDGLIWVMDKTDYRVNILESIIP